ncbi:DUF4435 domain-containing protein [Acuticoccus kandeliae]|uniref:DUF4435 domain-containing protein n=1 Tax=Acuticoccus kandeliae TaxID=2073160 RepID=UPI000D3E6636|nr:DUF4435 domain-containing protein [Acuticoccus kandeliae]
MTEITLSRLLSEDLFYNVDLVAYGEGHNNNMRDEIFWENVFEKHSPLRIRYKALGKKSEVLKVAHIIRKYKVSKVAALMDRDFDHIFNEILEDRNIIYTWGYSIENDAIHHCNLSNTLRHLCPKISRKEAATRFRYFEKSINSNLRDFFEVDVEYFREKIKLFDREKPLSIIKKDSTKHEIDVDALRQKAKGHNKLFHYSIDRTQVRDALKSPSRSVHGKTLLQLYMNYIISTSKEFMPRLRLDYDRIYFTMISTNREKRISKRSEDYLYYQPLITNLRL